MDTNQSTSPWAATTVRQGRHAQPTRRDFLRLAGAVASLGAWAAAAPGAPPGEPGPTVKPDLTLRIAPVLVEVTDKITVSTVGYNGSVPGPVLRLQEGKRLTVEVHNDTDVPELVHWHGQTIPAEVDGAAEEGTPTVPPHGRRLFSFVPGPRGTRFVHTHVRAGRDLHRGTYTGEFAFVYVEPRNDPGRYDQEAFLASHEWEPYFTAEEESETPRPADKPRDEKANGWEVGYRLFSINGKALGHGEPIRVKRGERVLFRILNASATENIQLALPGHQFEVVALDGNRVPNPAKREVLQLGVAERIDAVVTMDQPGVWVLGTPRDEDRKRGLGIVIEYAGEKGSPQWKAPKPERWDYTIFGKDEEAARPDETIEMTFRKVPGGKGGFNHWTINGAPYEESKPILIRAGRRYRLSFKNRNDDRHPLHLHRHLFELTKVSGKRTAGVMKDVVLIDPDGEIEVDFMANNPGLTLFHCHQQLHMDYGFMRLFQYV